MEGTVNVRNASLLTRIGRDPDLFRRYHPTAYIIRRLILIVPTLFAIMLVNFAIVQAVPGGPIERILSQIDQSAPKTLPALPRCLEQPRHLTETAPPAAYPFGTEERDHEQVRPRSRPERTPQAFS